MSLGTHVSTSSLRSTTPRRVTHTLDAQMDTLEEIPATYPSIWQSLLIVGIVILMFTACIPLMWLGARIGGEAAMLVYYVSGMGVSFYMVHSIRKRKLGASNYDFRIGSW